MPNQTHILYDNMCGLFIILLLPVLPWDFFIIKDLQMAAAFSIQIELLFKEKIEKKQNIEIYLYAGFKQKKKLVTLFSFDSLFDSFDSFDSLLDWLFDSFFDSFMVLPQQLPADEQMGSWKMMNRNENCYHATKCYAFAQTYLAFDADVSHCR